MISITLWRWILGATLSRSYQFKDFGSCTHHIWTCSAFLKAVWNVERILSDCIWDWNVSCIKECQYGMSYKWENCIYVCLTCRYCLLIMVGEKQDLFEWSMLSAAESYWMEKRLDGWRTIIMDGEKFWWKEKNLDGCRRNLMDGAEAGWAGCSMEKKLDGYKRRRSCERERRVLKYPPPWWWRLPQSNEAVCEVARDSFLMASSTPVKITDGCRHCSLTSNYEAGFSLLIFNEVRWGQCQRLLVKGVK